MKRLVSGCLAQVILMLLGGWYLMLGIGVVHAHIIPAVHPAGYGTSVLVLVLFGGAFSLGLARVDE